MIFGLKTRFAVESEVNELETEYVFGQICFWANDRRLGDYEQRVLLQPIADYLRETLDHQGQRSSELLSGLTSEQVLDRVYTALYGEVTENSGQQWQQYQKFCICPNGCEAFDGEVAVLLEDAEGERWIWRDFFDKKVYEMRLNRDEYEATVEAFLDWLDS